MDSNLLKNKLIKFKETLDHMPLCRHVLYMIGLNTVRPRCPVARDALLPGHTIRMTSSMGHFLCGFVDIPGHAGITQTSQLTHTSYTSSSENVTPKPK